MDAPGNDDNVEARLACDADADMPPEWPLVFLRGPRLTHSGSSGALDSFGSAASVLVRSVVRVRLAGRLRTERGEEGEDVRVNSSAQKQQAVEWRGEETD